MRRASLRDLTVCPITIWGDGSVVRDYLCIADLTDALELTADKETQDKVLNSGSGRGASLNRLLACMAKGMAKVVGEQPPVEYLPLGFLSVPVNIGHRTGAEGAGIGSHE